ncbi:MAG: trigger factor [Kocuria rhizophila]|uniref:trigger factor n=1 Tax=Kocuria carniphila TaxID=262208 RepID=UPI000DB79655|nr:trigger factor [Kocuria carniphila]MCT1802953.1 trigger factor [Kocuria carniphila]PZP29553.1 MAG: trigger factor [Kocuria rhizophila]
MKSAVEKLNPTEAKITVEIPYADLKPFVAETYKQLADQIQIPGFRKGKVPSKLIDQRVGFDFVIENALNEGLNDFYQQALAENELTPLSQPQVEVLAKPESDNREADTKVEINVAIRPEIELPDYKGLKVEVEAREATTEDEQKALDELRARFGTLKSVDRPAAEGDHVTLDLQALVAGEEVDAANDLSYEVGSGTMLEGMDEAVTGLSADEDATFETKLAGGEHSGADATVKVKVTAVKERELPEADDEFAQLASEFDTIDELKEDLKKQASESAVVEQGIEARDKVLDKLVELIEVPVPEKVIEDQLSQHFDSPEAQASAEPDHDTEEHRAEVRANAETAFRNEIILDAVAEAEEVGVEQSELIDYIINMSQQYGMDPNQFAQMLDGSGQAGMMVGEVRRRKALAKVLEYATVTDSKGNEVDLSAFVGSDDEDEAATEEAVETEAK